MKVRAISLAFLALAATSAAAQTAPTVGSNAEMDRLYAADQSDRQSGFTIDWSVVGKRDQDRRMATKMLLDTGALHSAEDFRNAAFVFQHGGESNDYLMAHTLAIIAVGKGDASALWIASAAMDRFLQKIGQPQIYGTQYTAPDVTKPEMTQEPYERYLVSDAMRRELGVPSLEQQRLRLQDLQAQLKASQTR